MVHTVQPPPRPTLPSVSPPPHINRQYGSLHGSLLVGQSTSVEVLRSGAYLFHEAKGLSPGMTYVFSVKAKTRINWGDANNATITVAPQTGG